MDNVHFAFRITGLREELRRCCAQVVVHYQAIGQNDDPDRTATAFIEVFVVRMGMCCAELVDPFRVRVPEAVDGLILVTDNNFVAVRQEIEEDLVRAVEILVLVRDDVIECRKLG